MRKHPELIAILTALLLLTACGRVPSGPSSTENPRGQNSPGTIVSGTEPAPAPGTENAGDSTSLPFPLGNKFSGGEFTGTAYLNPLISENEVYHFPQTNTVTFEPGARSGWHTHGGMLILAIGGVGYYQEEGKPAQILRKGDIVECPAGVNHWHGATPDSWFSQIVIYDAHYSGEDEEGSMTGPVTDEVYNSLEAEEYNGRAASTDSDLLFPRSAQAITMGTFSGPIYLSSLVGADNAANAPELHYVVFEPGVVNNWHSHEGGQILIATDGIGYHQIEGQPVEVLYPGDVAFCPPDVKHWHGGSADNRFAHIAINTNPERPGVQWFDRISDEEIAALPGAVITSGIN